MQLHWIHVEKERGNLRRGGEVVMVGGGGWGVGGGDGDGGDIILSLHCIPGVRIWLASHSWFLPCTAH